MIDTLVQFDVHSVETVSLILTLTSSVLGLTVGYIAFRGYQQNRSLPMLFVATGFLLVFWTPVLLLGSSVVVGMVGQFTPGMRETVDTAFTFAGEVSRIIGLGCILYGLRMPFSGE